MPAHSKPLCKAFLPLLTFPLPFALPINKLQEATKALKPILGSYYCKDDRNVVAALWQETCTCQYVQPDAPGGGVLWFHSMMDRPKGE